MTVRMRATRFRVGGSAYDCRNASGHFHRVRSVMVRYGRSVEQHHDGRQDDRFELPEEPLVTFRFFERALPHLPGVVEHVLFQLFLVVHVNTVVCITAEKRSLLFVQVPIVGIGIVSDVYRGGGSKDGEYMYLPIDLFVF